MSDTAKFLHALNVALGGEPQKLLKFLKNYQNPEEAWRALETPAGDPSHELKKLEQEGIGLLTRKSTAYPPLLQHIHEPPELLYYRGSPENIDWSIAVVGTRKPTEYGKIATRQFAEALARAGAVIVSGLAYGIDREAHAATVQTKGRAMAVIGSGLDRASFYPQANWPLAEEIVRAGGAVLSEYPPGKRALQSHFPLRNRIIAGMSQGVLLVEASERSGTQITARLAMEENRDVFAVPGSIFSETSKGPNRLIKEGAIPVTSTEDILQFYGREHVGEGEGPEALGTLEAAVLEMLREPTLIDDLKAKSGEEIHILQATLSLLELKGKVRELEPGRYQALTR